MSFSSDVGCFLFSPDLYRVFRILSTSLPLANKGLPDTECLFFTGGTKYVPVFSHGNKAIIFAVKMLYSSYVILLK